MRKIDADKIMFVAFGQDSKVSHVWLIPVDVLRSDVRFIVREDSADIWDEYTIDFGRAMQMLR